MSGSGKNSQALAFVNALQTILDSLTDESNVDETFEAQTELPQSPHYGNTYELFIDASSKKSLSSLMICITLVCALHHSDDPK